MVKINVFGISEGNIECRSIKTTFHTRIMPLSTLHNQTSFDDLEVNCRNFGLLTPLSAADLKGTKSLPPASAPCLWIDSSQLHTRQL